METTLLTAPPAADAATASITGHCAVRAHRVYLNGALRYEHPEPEATLADFLTAAYRYFGTQYPKFFKMDALSKLAFLTAELLLPATGALQRVAPEDFGVTLANHSSSLLTDLQHQQSIQDPEQHFPSPAVFVYTLPNIMIGEVSIRHQLRGENTLFVADAFEPETLQAYVDQLLAEGACQACLCGWIDAHPAGYEAFFYVVEPGASDTALAHQPESIAALYAAHS